MKLLRFHLLLLAILFSLFIGSADSSQANGCLITGFIATNTTWQPAGCNPYLVSGGVIVNPNVTLTIEPGTTIKFELQSGIEVRGMLVANGTYNQPVLFTSNQPNPTPGDWIGISFVGPAKDLPIAGGWLHHALIQFAGGGSAIVEGERLGAVRIYHAAPEIEQSTISESSSAGIYVWGNSSPQLTGNQIRNNGNTGIHIEGVGTEVQIIGNTIEGNSAPDTGGGIDVNGTPTIVKGNTIVNNLASTGGGIRFSSSGIIENNIINQNIAGSGGGVYYSGSATVISDNIITENIAYGLGGGMAIRTDFDSSQVTGNLISGNSAGENGGGLHITCCSVPLISNNVIVNNAVEEENGGGGIYCDWEVCAINNNNIFNNTSGITNTLGNDFTNGHPAGIPDIDAEANYWGTTDPDVIEDHVWHFFDDASLALVDYIPFLNQPISLLFPTLLINYERGSPGSYFTIEGSNFPPDTAASIEINGLYLGDVTTEENGELIFILDTTGADEGMYNIEIDTYPSASARFVLDNDEPVRPQEGVGPIFPVPAGISNEDMIMYLPALIKAND